MAVKHTFVSEFADGGDATLLRPSSWNAEHEIEDDSITYAQMQNVSATDRLLGRDSAGAGDVEEIEPSAARAMLDVPSNSETVLKTLIDASGDLIYGSAADTVARLPKGTDGEVLTLASGLPSWAAAGGGGGGTTHALARKTVDEPVVSSTTLQDDNELTFAIGANEEWVGEIFVIYQAHQTPDIKVTVAAPAGATGRWGSHHKDGNGNLSALPLNLGTEQAWGVGASQSEVEQVGTIWFTVINGATPGNVRLQFAQVASGTDMTKVNAHSHLVAHKVA